LTRGESLRYLSAETQAFKCQFFYLNLYKSCIFVAKLKGRIIIFAFFALFALKTKWLFFCAKKSAQKLLRFMWWDKFVVVARGVQLVDSVQKGCSHVWCACWRKRSNWSFPRSEDAPATEKGSARDMALEGGYLGSCSYSKL